MAHIIGTTQRRLETVLDDFKRARRYWKELNSEGFPVANKLVNAVIQSRYVDDSAYWHPVLIKAFPNVVQKYDGKMTVVIDGHSQKLENIVQKMATQQRKMQQHVQEMEAISNRTLSIGVQQAKTIVSMYESELVTKQSLASIKGFRHIKHREESLTLLSIWLNQPSLIDETLIQFEDMCELEMSVVGISEISSVFGLTGVVNLHKQY
ncbi:hypothetical protein PHYBLDRAFT_146567 [Phycomyces blakesleeanus NRRL 1555(-)]|uniref:Uncharacterized protein n=1 Tax=Phycomyces blakesleeanus (strain ATCC 8743b / DSM 1359 / FGSC 10004 / NBRC 33097 / NRRL 1555) TaxID=763407 RepID=A0A162PS21_PHYB8|nr:hypothetical protein PHYBLDRAFT_146567 [Phycomyces blakesleeanus NRRL 1555(-)]OAD72376.1 hypothetical protein PHYBLDRAFT_146567 [Phycomyces blakesleeanus NRRL 1555(-)]|eukprot:XP_018290416.1 hypothetical protein PHYBLDRAFT_146567 [Phycomyces blakesleeanus NRRL 1555(-)]